MFENGDVGCFDSEGEDFVFLNGCGEVLLEGGLGVCFEEGEVF